MILTICYFKLLWNCSHSESVIIEFFNFFSASLASEAIFVVVIHSTVVVLLAPYFYINLLSQYTKFSELLSHDSSTFNPLLSYNMSQSFLHKRERLEIRNNI